MMHPRSSQRLLQRRSVRTLPALNFGELGKDTPVAAVQVRRYGLALRFDAQPALALLPGADPVVRNKSPPLKPLPAPVTL
jgi:hypothetical protein